MQHPIERAWKNPSFPDSLKLTEKLLLFNLITTFAN